ncbi:MAG: hypothetical protein IJZ21_02340 [Clostridia bacterium]|nr:hypothetical protein [Clostridia bacterium]
MKTKHFICLAISLSMMLCTTACRKNADVLSSNTSNVSSLSELYGDVEFVESNNSGNTATSSVSDTTSKNNTSSKNDTSSVSSNTSSSSQVTNDKNVLAMLYGFSSIEKVDYYCAKKFSRKRCHLYCN